MKLHKKLIMSLGVAFLVATPLFSFVPAFLAQASAASNATGTWIDHSHIDAVIDGKHETLSDSKIDNKLQYTFTTAGCDRDDTVDGFNGNPNDPANATKTANLTYWRPSGVVGNSNCVSTSVKIAMSDPNNAFGIFFNWQDGGTISASDGKSGTFGSSDGKTFVVASGNVWDPGSKCKSYITPSSDNTTGQLQIQYEDSDIGNFVGWPGSFNDAVHAAESHHTNGCYVAPNTITVRLGNVDAASTAAGSSIDDNANSIDISCGGISLGNFVGQVLSLKWITCPLVNGFGAAAGVLDNAVMQMLCVNEQQIFSANAVSTCQNSAGVDPTTSAAYKTAWNVFRLIALGLLVIAGLVMILSQTMGLEIFDAYTIRKVLPRLLVAAIGVALSWQLMQFFVGLSNILGVGIRGLIYAPFAHANLNEVVLGGGTSAVGALTTLGAFALLGPLGILSLVATAMLAIFIAFFVLVIRNLLIVILIISAPVAIVAYILPNTEKYWKIWWDWFAKALMVFPMITAFIAVGHIFAAIATTQGGQQDGLTGTISNAAGFIAYFAPYFLIPAAFRFAGGALSTIGGFVNDRNRGAFDRLRKFRQNKAAGNFNRMRQGNLFRGGIQEGEGRNLRGRINRGFQYGTNMNPEIIGGNPARWNRNLRSHIANSEFDHAMEGLEKNEAMRAIAPDDDMLSAGLGAANEGEVRRRLEEKGRKGKHLEDSVAAVMAARRSMGAQAFDIAAAVGTFGTKTGYATEYDDDGNIKGKTANQKMAEALNIASGGDKQLAARMYGAGRGLAGRAGRLDLANPSFGTGVGEVFNAMDAAAGNGGGAVDEEKLAVDTFLNTDAVTLGRGDSRAVQNIMHHVGSRMNSLQRRRDAGETLSAAEQSELGRLSQGVQNMSDQGFYLAPQRVQSVQRALDRTARTRGKVEVEAERTVDLGQHEVVDPQTGQRVRANEVAEGMLEQRTTRSSNQTRGANDPNFQVQADQRDSDQQ